ncbi:hypothetical protein [Mucilaginibacter boryungensis]|uniref:Uncharacterized protein n=1 Tax=Mucilaginibacter boryungensis TaxID=768480 RepID=A0ABR9XCD0_9SPHI|nr:hypothetical protein [Mucilaginibacter boryungensis]MBE9664876.1 hypothetical protein [Mucilaginibacter boryungensis]
MINPEDDIPTNDADPSEADDQQSQKDIHSNGLDDFAEPDEDDGEADADRLQQASKAAEPSYTLNLDDATPADDN